MYFLYTDDYKLLVKEIKEYLNKRKIFYSWLGRINVVNLALLSKANFRINTFLIKIPVGFLWKVTN